MITWLRRLFCRHGAIVLTTTGAAIIHAGAVVLPGVEAKCSRCGEFWHGELDATAAMKAALES